VTALSSAVAWPLDPERGIVGIVFECPGCYRTKLSHLQAIPVKHPAGTGLRAKVHPEAGMDSPVWSAAQPPVPGTLLSLTPSLDTSRACGFHSQYNWQVIVRAEAGSLGEAMVQAEELSEFTESGPG